MRSLHSVEEKLYGPGMSKLSGNQLRVLLCIRHNSIRWDEEQSDMSYNEISRRTGISRRQVVSIVKKLMKDGLILKITTYINDQPEKNFIGLTKEYFGDLIEEEGRPKLSVINGGRQGGVVSSRALPLVSPGALPQCSREHYPQGQEPPPERGSGGLKNPSKEQVKNSYGDPDQIDQWNGEREAEEWVPPPPNWRNIIGSSLRRMPGS